MQNVAIVGVGLIGGSFGLALRRAGFAGRIVGVSSPQTIRTAIERGAIDEGADLAAAVGGADLVFLSSPISVIVNQLGAVDENARPGTLITDAGSTKVVICQTAQEKVRRALFLGGHPMAGRERSGIAAAEADLFQGRTWAVCPSDEVFRVEGRVREFMEWVRAIGARIEVLNPAEHDRAVAFTSHLPQLLSTALAACLHDAEKVTELAGPGLVDMTRLASSPYGIWKDILSTNEPSIRIALESFLSCLLKLTGDFGSPATESVFQIAQGSATQIRSVFSIQRF
jgi:prephenate dehydrogenase